MNDGVSDDVTQPWCAHHIHQTLAFCTGDRPQSANPAENAVWAQRGEKLLYWANRRPDVAARVLTSSLFSEASFAASSSSGPGGSKRSLTEERLHSMCEHALQVHKQYTSQSSGRNDNDSGGLLETPQEEVTFTASFVEPYVASRAAPALRRSLDCLLSGQQPPPLEASSESSNSGGMVQQSLEEVLQKHAEDYKTRACPHGVLSVDLPPLSQMSIFRAWSRPESRDTELLFRPHTPGPNPGSSQTPPFVVRTRVDTMRQTAADEAALNNATVVRAEGNIVAPQWAAERDRVQRAAEADAEAEPNPAPVHTTEVATELPAPTAAAETMAEGGEERRSEALPAEQPKPANVPTWIDDGELVMIDGRLVVQAAAPRKRNRSGKTEQAEDPVRTKAKPDVVADTATANQPTGGDGEASSQVVAESSTTVAKAGKGRKKKSGVPATQSSTAAAASVPIQDVPLKTREELLGLLDTWPIPQRLREALAIGLEAPTVSGDCVLEHTAEPSHTQ